MKNFPDVKSELETKRIIDIKTDVFAEWNINKYVDSAEIIVNDSIPPTDESTLTDSQMISRRFPVKSILQSGRGNLSGYVIDGTKYKVVPRYVNQKSRSENSWHTDTTWLWYGQTEYEYWVSSLAANNSGALPYNTGRIVYTWSEKRPCNKILIQFQKHHAFPSNWKIYLDLSGEKNWTLISTNPVVPASGIFSIYRETLLADNLPGEWGTSENLWTEELPNHCSIYGIKIEIDTVDVPGGRPGIIELSPRLEADMTGYAKDWNSTEEAGEQDFIAPIGAPSSNTGGVTFSNSAGTFNELDENNIFYGILDENVEVRGSVTINTDTVPMFNMISDSWRVEGFDTAVSDLVDKSKVLQGFKCNDFLASQVASATGLHMLFASLGLPQFELVETTPKETPSMERFYTKKEQTVWEVIQEVCRGLQLTAIFDSSGTLRLFSREASFRTNSDPDYTFTSEETTDRIGDLFSANREENARFNKVIVRYSPVNDMTLSGSKNQQFWTAPEYWTIGAAQIVKTINAGDDYMMIDPNKPQALPRYAGKFVIEDYSKVYDYEGMLYHCKNSTTDKYVIVKKQSDYSLALERNNGEAPRFTGKVFLKDDQVFERTFYSKGYAFREDWTIMEYQDDSIDGTRIKDGAKHSPVDGALRVSTSYEGKKRMCIFRNQKNWDAYDRVGMKFKVKDKACRTGIVVWPQGDEGASGYYFVVDPMTEAEITRQIKAGDEERDIVSAPAPEIHGFIIKTNGKKVPMDFDKSKDYKTIPPLRVNRWSYIEVVIYRMTMGFEFDVYIDGEYCKTFKDDDRLLNRNERAGMLFMGVGTTLVDKFYVVRYPDQNTRGRELEQYSGKIVTRKDLWEDRKASGGDKAFSKYLSAMDKKKKTKVTMFGFNGRYYGIAREKIVEKIRYEDGFNSLESDAYVSNGSVKVLDIEHSTFGAKLTLLNDSEKVQFLQGEYETETVNARRSQSTWIDGKGFLIADSREVEEKDEDSIDRIGLLPIEFESRWIQDYDSARDLARWVKNRFGKNSEVYTLTVFGNPLVEVGDVVNLIWPEKGFSDDLRWAVVSISPTWNSGLETTVKVRKII